MTNLERREPILEEPDIPEGREPLLLTKLVREGLPPPLWRRSHGTASEESDIITAPTPIPHPATASESPSAEAPASNTQLASRPQEVRESASTPKDHPSQGQGIAEESMEGAELARALERIRNLSFSYPAVDTARESAATTPSAQAETEAPVEPGRATPADPLGQAAPSAGKEEPTPALPALDLEFLQQFESLLFAQVERRVVHELEERVNLTLQKIWKEQVSLTLMRTLALEGIRLREAVVQEIQQALPGILRRILQEGFAEALIDPERHTNTDQA
ncbi:MAG: hypothetical protein JJ693_01830 [Acidithiobacillus sp.]|nr:hypothetical protein [Acidithiobacillus sp.]